MLELRRLLALAGPITLIQVGQMLLSVVDTLMVGRLGVHALAATQLGHLFVWGSATPFIGIVLGMDPLASQAHGARDAERSGLVVQRGALLALTLSIPLSLCWWYAEPALGWLGQDPELAHTAGIYARTQVWSAPFLLLYNVETLYLQARGIMRPGMVSMLVANLLNVLLNWVLIFGAPGLPGMGVRGASLATGITRVILVLALLIAILGFRLYQEAWTPLSRRILELKALRQQVSLGLPVGLQYTLEMWAFGAGSVLAGWIGERPLAAHSVSINLASFAFMVPLGISIGASVRVGNLLGEGRPEAAQTSAHTALKLCVGTSLASAAVFILGRSALPRLYTDDPAVLAMAASILPVAAAFQVMDGLQAVGGGVLRGMGRPLPAVAFNLLSYAALTLPLAYFLGLKTSVGVVGIWYAYALGLAVVAGCLVPWVVWKGPATVRALDNLDAAPGER